jgi:hypothetical protein
MAEPKTFYDPFNFRIEGAGGEVIGWAWEAGPFKETASTTEIPAGAGGQLRDIPMTVKMAQFTVSAPMSTNKTLYNRFKAMHNAVTGKGTNEPDVYEDLDFVQINRDGTDVERTRVYDAVAIDYENDSHNKKGNEKRMEKLIFSGRTFERIAV